MTAGAAVALTVYFDGSCELCTAEINALQACDRAGLMRLVDCSPAGFRDADADAAGISRAEMMEVIHARDARGLWLRGIDVFEAMYRIAGFETMARLWSHPWLHPLLSRGYPWVVRNRTWLSRTGLVPLFGWIARRRAARAVANACSDTCNQIKTRPGTR